MRIPINFGPLSFEHKFLAEVYFSALAQRHQQGLPVDGTYLGFSGTYHDDALRELLKYHSRLDDLMSYGTTFYYTTHRDIAGKLSFAIMFDGGKLPVLFQFMDCIHQAFLKQEVVTDYIDCR